MYTFLSIVVPHDLRVCSMVSAGCSAGPPLFSWVSVLICLTNKDKTYQCVHQQVRARVRMIDERTFRV